MSATNYDPAMQNLRISDLAIAQEPRDLFTGQTFREMRERIEAAERVIDAARKWRGIAITEGDTDEAEWALHQELCRFDGQPVPERMNGRNETT